MENINYTKDGKVYCIELDTEGWTVSLKSVFGSFLAQPLGSDSDKSVEVKDDFNIRSVLEDAITNSVYSGSFPPEPLIALYINTYGG